MKRWIIPLVLSLSSMAMGQAVVLPDQNCAAWGAAAPASNLSCNNTGPYASGTQIFLPDARGTITNQFEVLVIGTAPASLTTTVVGCMRGGTCSSTLASSSGTSSQIVTPTTANLNIYDKYGITVSWTGGDATTRFVINRSGTTARVPGSSGGSGTVSANSGSAGAIAFYAAAGGSTTVSPDANLTDAASTLTYSAGPLVVGATGVQGCLTLFGATSGSSKVCAVGNATEWDWTTAATFHFPSGTVLGTSGGGLTLAAVSSLTLNPGTSTGVSSGAFGFTGGKGQHFNTQAASSDTGGVATCAASTVTVTFTTAYTSTPTIVVSDETAAGGARVSAKSNTSFTITCTGATDVVDYMTIGNPT